MEARHLLKPPGRAMIGRPRQAGMSRWSPWRSVLAGAVIGFVEAAGSDRERRVLRQPDAVVRFDHRGPHAGDPPAGLWFLASLRDIRRYLSRN